MFHSRMITRRFPFLLLAFAAAVSTLRLARAAEPSSSHCLVYVGTYTGPKSKGIYVYRLDTKSGALESIGLAAEISSPSFLAIDPTEKFLFAANDIDRFSGKSSGAVSSFSIDPESGKLKFLNDQPSGGPGPCHVSVDHSGKF